MSEKEDQTFEQEFLGGIAKSLGLSYDEMSRHYRACRVRDRSIDECLDALGIPRGLQP